MQTFAKNGERPLYEQVREHLRQQCLLEGAETALPSLRQMSELLGVNHITISRALRELEAEGLLKIVPGKGTFIARPTETGTCIEMLTMYAYPHAQRHKSLSITSAHTLRGMQEGLKSNFSLAGTTLVIPPVPQGETVLSTFKSRGVAAVSVFGFGYLDYPESFEETRLIYELDRAMPVVLIGKEHPLLQLDCIYCDPTLQMRAFLDECYEKGMRRFTYFGHDDNLSHLRLRVTAMKEFLLARGLPMVQPSPDFKLESLEGGALALLSMKERPQVFVAPIPSVANHLIVAAHRSGWCREKISISSASPVRKSKSRSSHRMSMWYCCRKKKLDAARSIAFMPVWKAPIRRRPSCAAYRANWCGKGRASGVEGAGGIEEKRDWVSVPLLTFRPTIC